MHSSLVNIQKVHIEAFVVTPNFLVYFFLLFCISMVCCRPSYHPKQCELFETLKEGHALIIHPPGCTHGNAIGSKCTISCEQNFVIPFYIPQVSICTKSGEWSPPIPKCRTDFKRQSERNQEHCKTLEILEEHNSLIQYPPGCTNDFIQGSICYFKCKHHFVTLDEHLELGFSTCKLNGEWDPPIPTCVPITVCSSPEFPYGVKFSGNCSMVEVATCPLTCINSLILYGPSEITCRSSRQWTEIPNCGCAIPQLSESQEIQSLCVPHVGKTCTIRCKDGFMMDGSPKITCHESGHWSELPNCFHSCPEPHLPSYLKLSGNCTRKEGYGCQVVCLENKTLEGSSTITCLSNNKWTEMPICINMGVNNYILSKNESGILTGNNIMCPELTDYRLILQDNCTRHTGSQCYVSCIFGTLQGSPLISCASTGQWSFLPTCEDNVGASSSMGSPLVQCLSKGFPDGIRKIGSCSTYANTSCEVGCFRNNIFLWKHTIYCLPTGEWSEIKLCKPMTTPSDYIRCPELQISYNIIVENCTKELEPTCFVSCPSNNILQGPDKITCLNSGNWTDLPLCQAISTYTMQSNIYWDKRIQNSSCPQPTLSEGMILQVDCSNIDGTTCTINCNPDMFLNGPQEISCKNGTWSEFPKCEKKKSNISTSITNLIVSHTVCPEIALPYGITLLENCIQLTGVTCRVHCESGMTIIGPEVINCLPTGKWSSMPSCIDFLDIASEGKNIEDVCPDPKLPPYLNILSKCKRLAGVKCSVGCQNNLYLNGSDTISCMSFGRWSSMPTCVEHFNETSSASCPRNPPGSLLFADDCHLEHGQSCQAYCQYGLVTDGSIKITCHNGKWINTPNCITLEESKTKHITCGDPQLPPFLHKLEVCKTNAGLSCAVGCEENKSLIGPFVITCLPEGKWSSMPTCVGNENETSGVSCPRNPPGSLLFADDCHLEHGQSCQAYCQYGLVTDGSIKITCHNGKWINTPNCITLEESKTKHITCGDPQLPPFLHKLEVCKTNAGLSCAVGCEENKSLIGPFVITCLPEGKWSSMPTCVGNENDTSGVSCPRNPPGSLLFADDCHLQHGQSCQAYCQYGLVTDGSIKITCHNGKWINTPNCITLEESKTKHITCGDPQLPPFLHKLEVCKTNAGLSCAVGCEENKSLIGPFVITCLPEGKWSSMPTCVGNENDTSGVSCPRNPPGSLLFADDCHLEHGQSCQAYCQYGLVTDGSIKITCHNGKWINTPNCITLEESKTKHITCGDPQLPPFLHKLEVCKTNAGLSCAVGCEENKSLIGPFVITCLPEGKWSSMPTCIEELNETSLICAEALPHGLSYSDQCRNKDGQSCFVHCENGLALDGSSEIICKNGKWSNVPKCVKLEESNNSNILCTNPNLPDDVKLLENCKTVVGISCALGCHGNKLLEGPNSITCLYNGTWSPMPICVNMFYTSQNCPDNLPDGLAFADKCSKKDKSICQVYCEDEMLVEGSIAITCVMGKWTNMPKCINHEEISGTKVVCPSPVLHPDVRFFEECKGISGASCALDCKDNLAMQGPVVITCLSDGKWSIAPNCVGAQQNVVKFCSDDLSDGLAFADKCSKKDKSICQVYCEDEMLVEGSIAITCVMGKWANMPKCINHEETSDTKVVCPSPVLHSDIRFFEECKGISGASCALDCNDNLAMQGPVVITCLSDGKWSDAPNCINTQQNVIKFCPEELPRGLAYANYCSKINDQSCIVYCEDGLALRGSVEIACKNGEWENIPQCIKPDSVSESQIVCPEPEFPSNVITLKECQKMEGISCFLGCRDNMSLKGPIVTTCLPNKKWSQMPICLNHRHLVSSSCPHILPNGISFVNNCKNEEGESCQVYCENGLADTDSITIACINGKWMNLPNCTKIGCEKPVLPNDLFLSKVCTDTVEGSVCYVDCKNNLTLEGNNMIKCLPIGKWSDFPKCVKMQIRDSCPKPQLHKGIEIIGNCDKTDGTVCHVNCVNGILEGPDVITCLAGSWSSSPSCIVQSTELNADFYASCLPPKLPNNIVPFGPCPILGKRTCDIGCIINGTVLWKEAIECLPSGIWSDLPPCTSVFPTPNMLPTKCPNLNLNYPLQVVNNCNNKIGTICFVTCQEGLSLNGPDSVMCLPSGNWSSYPTCVHFTDSSHEYVTPEQLIIECRKPPPLPDGVVLLGPCSTIDNTVCKIGCIRNSQLLWSDRVFCLPSGTWSEVQHCPNVVSEIIPKLSHIVCQDVQLSENLMFSGNCTEKTAGSRCQVVCKDPMLLIGNDSITCLVSGEWSEQPKCILSETIECEELELPLDVQTVGTCHKNVGSVCMLSCPSGMFLNGPKQVTCLSNKKWSEFPVCVTFHLNKGTRPKSSRSENYQDPIEDNCPLGYFYHSGQCYGLTPEVKGIDIQNLCHPPLHPLVIENQETYDFIVHVIRINKTICLWTGISDTKEEGVWYDSRGNLAKFLPWDKGEPSEANTLRAKVQNCVVMTKWDEYMYHDYSCYTLSCNFMCQFSAFL